MTIKKQQNLYMKKKLPLALLSLLISSFITNAGILVLEGKFQNKNLYVQNSFGSNGVGFCTTEIKVNGSITTDEVNSSAFEIDLMAMNIKVGQKVIIEISHQNDCTPLVINPEVLKPKPTYEIVNMNINANGVFKWSAKNENGSLPYIIEQFKWNKWVYIGEVQGVGSPELHEYSFQVYTHSGENKFRIKQVGIGVGAKTSNSVSLYSMIQKPTYMFSKDLKAIQYSYETAFEVYDSYGTIVKKGFGNQTNIDNLPKGKYFLCYDNQITEFDKRR
jgi:hypothetical protein